MRLLNTVKLLIESNILEKDELEELRDYLATDDEVIKLVFEQIINLETRHRSSGSMHCGLEAYAAEHPWPLDLCIRWAKGQMAESSQEIIDDTVESYKSYKAISEETIKDLRKLNNEQGIQIRNQAEASKLQTAKIQDLTSQVHSLEANATQHTVVEDNLNLQLNAQKGLNEKLKKQLKSAVNHVSILQSRTKGPL